METWRDIPGFEGRYQVSDKGNVYSIRRQRCLKLGKCTNGYLSVQLGRGNPRLAHRLVALAFVGGAADGLEVNHKNGIRSDNRAENLEWVTRGDNHRHSYRELNRKKHAKTRPVVLRRGEDRFEFESELSAAKHLGVVPGSVSSAARHGHKCRGHEVLYG